MTDYEKYRGKCQELSKQLAAQDPSLRLVRGHYICPIWGEQQHWWCVAPDGTIHDPTKLQFPSKGIGEYIEFNGIVNCEVCGKELNEKEAAQMGRYFTCSDRCTRALVGV